MAGLDFLEDGDEFVIDLSGVEDKDFADFVPDTYNVVLTKIERGPNVKSKSGNLKVVLTFDVEDGDYKGRKLFMHPVLEGKALWKTRKTFKALGAVAEDGAMRINEQALLGTRVRGEVTVDSAEYGSIETLHPALPQALGDL